MADVFSYILDMMRVRGTAYVGKNLSAPWRMVVEEHAEFARFHLVLSGATWVEVPELGARERLGVGDFAIIPNGRAHVMCDAKGRRATTSSHIPHVDIQPDFQLFDGAFGGTHMLCGYFQISNNTPPTILSRFPEIMVERGDAGPQDQKVKLITELIGSELSKKSGPTQAVLNRLTEILCVYAIHSWLKRSLAQDTQISALVDPRLHMVLDAIHAHPEKAWTVESLAEVYGQSRTAFAVQFKAAMGVSPIHYVTRWRVRLAQKMLEESKLSLDDVADRTGYADTNAFNRAFKRETGTPPATFRRISRV